MHSTTKLGASRSACISKTLSNVVHAVSERMYLRGPYQGGVCSNVRLDCPLACENLELQTCPSLIGGGFYHTHSNLRIVRECLGVTMSQQGVIPPGTGGFVVEQKAFEEQ